MFKLMGKKMFSLKKVVYPIKCHATLANTLEFLFLLQIGKKIDRELHSLCAKRVMPFMPVFLFLDHNICCGYSMRRFF